MANENLEVSLIPTIDKVEKRLVRKLEHARQEAEARIRQAREQSQEHLENGRQELSVFIKQKQNENTRTAQDQVKALGQLWEQQKAELQQLLQKNMSEAVERVVSAVIGTGDQP